MDLNLYPVFIEVYENDTLKNASEKLCISQSAVSHALARLRETLGHELFVKNGRTLEATAYARELYPNIKQALALVTQATNKEALQVQLQKKSHITIAMNNEIELVLLPQIVHRLSHQYPHIAVHSVRLDRKQMNRQLKLGIIDIAIDIMRAVPSDIYQSALLTDKFIVLSNNVSKQGVANIPQNDYLNAAHITVSSRAFGQAVEDIRLAQLGFHRQVLVRCQHYESAIRLLKNSTVNYLLTLPTSLADTMNIEGLHKQALPFALESLSLHMYWHQDRDQDGINQWIRNHCSRCSQFLITG